MPEHPTVTVENLNPGDVVQIVLDGRRIETISCRPGSRDPRSSPGRRPRWFSLFADRPPPGDVVSVEVRSPETITGARETLWLLVLRRHMPKASAVRETRLNRPCSGEQGGDSDARQV